MGTVFTARTHVGAVGFDDPMEIVSWAPPADGEPGRARIEKRGSVMTGWAELTVAAHGSGSRATWREDVSVARTPAFAAGLTEALVPAVVRTGAAQAAGQLNADERGGHRCSLHRPRDRRRPPRGDGAVPALRRRREGGEPGPPSRGGASGRASADERGLSWTGPERLVLQAAHPAGSAVGRGSGRVVVAQRPGVATVVPGRGGGRPRRHRVGRRWQPPTSGSSSGACRSPVARVTRCGCATRCSCFTRTLRAVDRVDVGSGYRRVPEPTVSASNDPDRRRQLRGACRRLSAALRRPPHDHRALPQQHRPAQDLDGLAPGQAPPPVGHHAEPG